MAQQSVRRDQENQGFPPCLEHAVGDLDRIRELPYRPETVRRLSTGRTDGSIRLRVRISEIHSCAEGGRPQMEGGHRLLLNRKSVHRGEGPHEVVAFRFRRLTENFHYNRRLLTARHSLSHHDRWICGVSFGRERPDR